ncbi:MAG: histidine kinase [Planctomycetes bacterium]|nr:histidine kinase [Planctomycetota bacterium]
MTSGAPESHELELSTSQSFHALMRRRVRRILLVSSLYDSFIMSEEGQLQETLLTHFLALNLSHFPDILRVPSGAEALALLARDDSFDLVIASLEVGGQSAVDLALAIKAAGHEQPVVALAYTGHELRAFLQHHDRAPLERVFLWQGDVRIFLAIVKSVEDRMNVAHDTGEAGVPLILLVEDNVRFYSSFLPAIYAELLRHTQALLSEDLSLSQKMMHMRARPKVLLCETYEDAWRDFERYEAQTLGVISDVEYPRGGRLDPRAGVDLCAAVKARRRDVRLVLQSSVAANRELADSLGASFLQKGSPTLLADLRELLVRRFGFGDFTFRLPDGTVVATAHDPRELAERILDVPAESLVHHASRNHFSLWLKARTELALAERLRPKSVDEFPTVDDMRRFASEAIQRAREERNRTVIAEFDRAKFDPTVGITRVGEGSLGGKARGLAFGNRLLRASGVDAAFPSVDVFVPPSIVFGTGTYDEFLQYEWIQEFALGDHADQEILEMFLAAPFPRGAVADLRAFLQRVSYPIAVRSSSLLEDSLAQPFAGVYRTHFLANNDDNADVRLERVKNAIKSVYASAFSAKSKAFLDMTSFRLEEEKMAVMVQELVGRQHGDRFYPDFSGVARSYNYYPEPGHRPEDGVAAVALGMGRTVVDGSPCLRFSPRYPRELVSFSSVEAALANSQRAFWALDLDSSKRVTDLVGLRQYPLDVAEQDGTLTFIGSTYLPDDLRIVDGISRAGVRLVSFAQVLKHGAFPLAAILNHLLERCERGTGAPVEIEFAGNLGGPGQRPQFAFLQLRPLAVSGEGEAVSIGAPDPARVLCQSGRVLGNGHLEGLRDLVVVDVDSFDRSRSVEIAAEVARFDAWLRREGRPYALFGVGRWGSADPLLGIPVSWNQICGARVIVECGFKDLVVEPSQGTHFFQNLSSSQVGYFTVNPGTPGESVDWAWLAAQPAEESTAFTRRLRLAAPLDVRISAQEQRGVIEKPRG